ncbi:MAG TPA: hypothetical protein VEK57_31765 [Thermoanaerobaculia bacterium]|nr:hypothetical protein [Thermoanaerobaculia bacterium]
MLTTTSLLAQPAYFAPPAPLTNTRYTIDAATGPRANDQSLIASASAANGTLVVWNEGIDAHVGIRGVQGAWRERALVAGELAVAAASDGRDFAVISESDGGWRATLLDDAGLVLQQSALVDSFQAKGVASNGSDYVVAGVDGLGNVVAARLLRDGSVSAPVILRAGAEDPVVTSDGTNYLVLWQTPAAAIEGVRLDGTLQRLDAADLVVFDTEAEDPAVAFNGSDYVVVWRGGPYLRGRRVRVDGTVVPEFVQVSASDGEPPSNVRLSRLGTQTGLTWFDGRGQAVIFDGWTMQAAEGFDTGTAPLLTALPNAGVALLRNDVADGEPHYGGRRVFASVAHPAPPSAPLPPRVELTANGARLEVQWDAQTVSGYRLEVRIDGPWLEYDAWIDGTAASTVLEAPRSGSYAIRVRAFGDGGMSGYSETAEATIVLRRRAVR